MKNILPQNEKERLEKSSIAYHGEFNDENIRNISWITKQIVNYANNYSNILELGLGDGTTTKILASYFEKVTTLDGSSKLISDFKNKTNFKNVDLVETLFEDYESDELFDNIIMSNILEHVYDPDVLIEKYKEKLRPKGKLYLSVPSAKSLNRRIGNIAGMLPDIYAFQEQDIILGHRRYYCKDTFLKFLEKHKLIIEKVEGVNLKVITTNQMKQLNFNEKIYNAFLELGKDYPELCTMVFVVASI